MRSIDYKSYMEYFFGYFGYPVVSSESDNIYIGWLTREKEYILLTRCGICDTLIPENRYDLDHFCPGIPSYLWQEGANVEFGFLMDQLVNVKVCTPKIPKAA